MDGEDFTNIIFFCVMKVQKYYKLAIVLQFLFEAVMISISGGLIGIILGVSMASIVSNMAEIPTIITFASIVLSFGVAATIGLIFGITPARRAAMQDPITSLRHE